MLNRALSNGKPATLGIETLSTDKQECNDPTKSIFGALVPAQRGLGTTAVASVSARARHRTCTFHGAEITMARNEQGLFVVHYWVRSYDAIKDSTWLGTMDISLEIVLGELGVW